jgi:hypothetical protein
MNKQNLISLINHQTKAVIFEGYFSSVKECVEEAINKRVKLDYVDLSGQNLSCANMDDGSFHRANFSHSNLMDANLSECDFTDANFSYADLTSACIAISVTKGCRFYQTSFCMTDVTDAVVKNCVFSCPSVFDVAFARSQHFGNNIFYAEGQGSYVMNEPPIVIHGLCRPVVFIDDMVKIGHDFYEKGVIADMRAEQLVMDYGEKTGLLLCALLSQKQYSFMDLV